jgi:hypothetical protein
MDLLPQGDTTRNEVVSPLLIHAAALGLTILSEATAMALYLHLRATPRRELLFCVGSVVVINLITHTLFWFTFPLLPLPFFTRLHGYEILIALVEGAAYWWLWRFSWREALALGVVLNLISYVVGLALWYNLFS